MMTRTWTLLVAAALCVACGTEEPPPPPEATCEFETGILCTWAGTGEQGFNGDGQPSLKSQLALPMDVTFDRGNTPYIVDFANHRVRRVKADGTLETVVGTDGAGNGDVDELELTAGGAWGDQVSLTHPSDAFVAADGALIVTTWDNHRLRRYDPATNVARVIAGTEMGFAGDGASARTAKLNRPSRAVQASSGEIFVLDQRNLRIRRLSSEPVPKITSPIGSGSRGINVGAKLPPEAKFSFDGSDEGTPEGGMVFDVQGNLFIADTGANRIYRVNAKNTEIVTFAGNGTAGYAGDGGPAVEAQLNGPRDLAISANVLYVADTENHAVRAIELGSGTIRTVAGTGEPGFSGDAGPAASAQLNRPHGVAIDTKGVLYISDTFNNRIRRLKLQ